VDCGAFYEVTFSEPSLSIVVETFFYSLNVPLTRAPLAARRRLTDGWVGFIAT
jgi:hypothetical protein